MKTKYRYKDELCLLAVLLLVFGLCAIASTSCQKITDNERPARAETRPHTKQIEMDLIGCKDISDQISGSAVQRTAKVCVYAIYPPLPATNSEVYVAVSSLGGITILP